MKILLISNHSYMLYRTRRELIQELMKDHEVVLAMPFAGHEGDFQAMGLRCIHTEVDRRGMDPRADGKLLRTYLRILQEEQPDLTITYSIKPNIYGGLLCAALGIPYCANVQGLGSAFQRRVLSQFVTVLYRAALRKAKTVLFENQGDARKFLDKKIISPQQTAVLPGAGVNLEQFPLCPYPCNPRIHFLYLGRIMGEKGIGELFTALRRLHREMEGRIVLDLVGFFDDHYEAEVNRLVSEGIVRFHGFHWDPQPYYAAADCIVLPSYHEGMSNVLLEAAATGRPVITSSIHGCREAVDDGKTGLLCPVRDADSLYARMRQMAMLSREDRAAMGLAAREKMAREFEKNDVVRQSIHAILS